METRLPELMFMKINADLNIWKVVDEQATVSYEFSLGMAYLEYCTDNATGRKPD